MFGNEEYIDKLEYENKKLKAEIEYKNDKLQHIIAGIEKANDFLYKWKKDGIIKHTEFIKTLAESALSSTVERPGKGFPGPAYQTEGWKQKGRE